MGGGKPLTLSMSKGSVSSGASAVNNSPTLSSSDPKPDIPPADAKRVGATGRSPLH